MLKAPRRKAHGFNHPLIIVQIFPIRLEEAGGFQAISAGWSEAIPRVIDHTTRCTLKGCQTGADIEWPTNTGYEPFGFVSLIAFSPRVVASLDPGLMAVNPPGFLRDNGGEIFVYNDQD